MTSVAGAKGNVGSRAMEATLTPTSTEMSPDEWQSFLIKTMNDVSGPLARNMLDKIGLNASTATPFRLLDHGCGLGVVAPVLMETVPKAVLERSSVLCGDYSEALVQTVRARIEREGWVGCEAKVVDAQDSGLPAESFTHVVSNIMYHTVPDSEAALKDSIRLVAPGGTLAFTTWHSSHTAWIGYISDAFASFPADLLPPHYAFHFPMQTTTWGRWYDVDWVRDTLLSMTAPGAEGETVGKGEGRRNLLEDVHVEVFAHTSPAEDVGHFMKMFEKMLDWVADLALGAESIQKLGGREGVKKRVEEYLRGRFGTRGWTLVGVSICAWGKKSGN